MQIGKRLATVGGVAVGAMSWLSFPKDLVGLSADLSSEVARNPFGSAGLAVGLALIAWGNRDALRAMFGFGRSDHALERQIIEWTFGRRKWELIGTKAEANKAFHVAFRLPFGEGKRTINVIRDRDSEYVIVALGTNIGEPTRKQLAILSEDQRRDLHDDLRLAMVGMSTELKYEMEGGLPSRYEVVDGFHKDAELSEMAFLERVSTVARASETLTLMIQRAARRAAATANATSTPST